MLISEIFTSIDGEGRRAGELATFIRSVGCNLSCSYCDSLYTWKFDSTCRVMAVDDIVKECDGYGVKNITFTGGEPLLQKDADDLILTLARNGYDVSIETDGAVDFTDRTWFKNNHENIWVCVDYKCYASGMTDKMLPLDKFAQLRDHDVLKFVVGSRKDLELAYHIISHIREKNCNCYVYLSPVFGMIEPREIVEFMQEKNLQDRVRVQLQLHKIIWDPNRRAV